MSQNMPAAEVPIDSHLVRALLEEQHPDLAGLAVREVSFGWDHAIFRLGDELVVQMPRRAIVADLVPALHRWLPELAPRLPLPISVPVRTGAPGVGFPWPWTICPWLPGVQALEQEPDDLEAAAVALGEFVAALAQPAPDDAPVSPYRGGPLAERDPHVRERVANLGSSIDGAAVLALWDESLAVPVLTGPRRWLHGDLHPGNLLVDGGRLSAVIDFVDLAGGDPATDLIAAWTLLPPDLRPAFRAAAGATDDDLWRRGRGWALYWATAVVAGSADNPVYEALGRRTLAAVLGG
jgi:aminoglycoside phosphotransferase (APT) family kinase protein